MDFFSKKDLIGLDIGSSSVKILELQNTRKGYALKNVGIAFLPQGTIVDGALKEPQIISDIIRDLVASLKIKAKNVATSISGHPVIIKNISLPSMTEKELEDSLEFESEQYIPFDIEDVNIDFQILRDNPEDNEQMDVLLVAAKRDLINDYISVIEGSGLKTMVMDVDAFALENMFEANYTFEEGEAIAIINVGASILNMNVIKEGVSIFTRDVSIGGNRVTTEIQKGKDISFEEAEALKVSGQIEEVGQSDLEDLIEAAFQPLALEIRRSLDFFWVTFADERISKIFLSGGCARSNVFKRIVQDKIGDINVEVVNPFASIDCSGGDFDPEYIEFIAPFMAIGVGLALRRVGDR
ncbi:MAG: type IV pilus assembly protein PilM [Thermodesulfobacteriota bacterium]|nr:type IV pilus assembly protein PilM [Thermodesulfobacteriota bacterium]